MLKITIQCQEF